MQVAERAGRADSHGRGIIDRSAPFAIDHDHLRRYTMGDLQLEMEVLALFAGELPRTLAALKTSSTETEWRMAAHTLKGSSRAVGAWRVSRAAVAAEQNPLAVYDPIGRAELIGPCELAVGDVLAYIRSLSAPA
jgi:HPt (histidine-containing phosphotransfer) domain-containing protein